MIPRLKRGSLFKVSIAELLCGFGILITLGCDGDQPRQVQETSEMTFDEVADRIEQESMASEDEE